MLLSSCYTICYQSGLIARQRVTLRYFKSVRGTWTSHANAKRWTPLSASVQHHQLLKRKITKWLSGLPSGSVERRVRDHSRRKWEAPRRCQSNEKLKFLSCCLIVCFKCNIRFAPLISGANWTLFQLKIEINWIRPDFRRWLGYNRTRQVDGRLTTRSWDDHQLTLRWNRQSRCKRRRRRRVLRWWGG